jgi:acetyl esterase
MTIDADIAALLARTPAAQPASLERLRAETDRALMAMHGTSEEVERIENFAVEAEEPSVLVPVRAYRPLGTTIGEKPPAMVFAHAGGWRLCSLDVYDNPCRALANATGCVVFSVGYRLAPEHPYPVPLEDVYRALRRVADHADELRIDETRLVVAGDSAGGNLAAAAAMLARDRGGPPIAHQLLLYPALDTDLDTPSYRKFGEGYYLTHEVMRLCWNDYLGDRLSAPPVYAAPLRAELRGLPSATILVNEYDPLRSEGEAYARKLEDNGVPATLILLEGMIHACIHMLGIAPAAAALFVHAGREIRRRFGLPERQAR